MPRVSFTQALKRFYPDLEASVIEAANINDLLINLDESYPGIRDYLVDDQGSLRQHVNIFIGENMIQDKKSLSDKIKEDDEVYIFQALSGG